jgi:hypothetical protein
VKAVTTGKKLRIFICPSCKTKVICEGKIGKKYLGKCPSCRHKGIFYFKKEKKEIKKIEIIEIEQDQEGNKKDLQRERKYFSMNHFYILIQIVGILLILTGIGFLITTPRLNLKLSFTLIFFGCLLLLMISETRKPKQINNEQSEEYSNIIKNAGPFMPEIISFSIILWTLFLFFITSQIDFVIFFICVFFGILVAKELTDGFTTIHLKKRINIFLFVFLIGTILIIAQKIITM